MSKHGRDIFFSVLFGASLFIVIAFLLYGVYSERRQKEIYTPAITINSFVRTEPEIGAIASSTSVVSPVALAHYIEVVDSCGPYWGESCLNARSGPGVEFDSLAHLRSGMVLRVAETVENEQGKWHKIMFDEWLRYPERLKGDWYVSDNFVRSLYVAPPTEIEPTTTVSTTKLIIVDRSEQMLYAYEGVTLVMEQKVSTGLLATPTPRGTFRIYKKTPSRYMQGPIVGINTKYYDLPGVPWNLYFTYEGAVIHGAYWHDKFGQVWSSGCVNLFPEQARAMYEWADLGTPVAVRD